MDAWCRNSSLISLSISLLDTREDEIKFRFDEVRNDTVLSINEPDLATGNIRVAAGIDPINGKFRIYVNFNTTISKTAYKWVLEYHCQSEADLDVWACDSRCDFQRMGLFGYEMGSSVYSINDMATGRNTISVGSFAARTANGIAWGNIAPSSSYGSLPDGRSLPLVAAPGVGVISSVSGDKDNTPVFVAYDDDAMQHRWAIKSGTSMSAPCVAGIIALWKQACPSLTPQQIQEILTESSTNDVFTASNPVRWGSGKIDALQGILRAFAMMRNQCDVNCDGVVDVADANLVIDVILGLRYDEKTDVTGDGITDVADINRVVNVILNRLRP